MYDYDIAVIGSGHNGLTSACYLAKAGYKVGVFERRDTIGGAVCTETMFNSERFPQGFRVDVGSSAHIMIHQTGIVEELELEKYGLEYIEMDPFASFPLPDKKGVIHFFKDLDRTLDSIAKVAPEDVQNYKNFIEFWGRVNRGVLDIFNTVPTPMNLGRAMMKGQFSGKGMVQKGNQVEGLRTIFSSYGQVVEEAFESEYLKTAILWIAAQSGPTPDVSATADFAGWQAMIHDSGAKHPRGGSGMLTQAMKNYLEAHGGKVFSDMPVSKILVSNKRAVGLQFENGQEVRARAIVSNAHVQTTMLKLVGPDHLDSKLFRRVEKINVGNGFGMVIRCAVEELPQYTACPDDPFVHNGLQLLCPSRQRMNEAIGDYMKGIPPERPLALPMTFSKIDEDVAPSGGETMFVWAQWHPYQLSNGEHWDDIREREAEKIYNSVVEYAPNMKGKLIDWYIQSPLDIERKHGLLRGNVMHVEMTFEQMFMFRPTPELSTYETPIKGLFLSSASCHPGGGVFGAAGRNAAGVVLKNMKKLK